VELSAQQCEPERDERVEYHRMKHGFASLRPRSSHSRRSRNYEKMSQAYKKKREKKYQTFVTRDFGAPQPTLEGMKTRGFLQWK
jgi:hypothetical protein